MQKVVLGFSGGLDTSVLIKLIKGKYHAEVLTVSNNSFFWTLFVLT